MKPTLLNTCLSALLLSNTLAYAAPIEKNMTVGLSYLTQSSHQFIPINGLVGDQTFAIIK